MILKRKSEDRGHVRFPWLDGKYSFSFGSYFDPNWMGFSKLRVINEDIIDEGIYISDKDAFARVDELLRKEGILAGTSCGTLVDAAIKWCQKQTKPKKVVTLICDTGNKYLSKAFNKDWLKENELID